MPLQKLQFRPGINREGTNYSNEGGWYDCDKIRFRSGYPQKIGGWVRATSGYTYKGVCRMLINWVDLSNNNLIGIGTHLKYYVNNGLTEYRDITPLRKTTNPMGNNPFAATNTSVVVTVTDTTHGAQVGDYVIFSGATAFAGIPAAEINAEFKIINIIDANTYQIEVPSNATSTTSGGGNAVIAKYQINIGLAAYTIGNGFGAGVWNGLNTSLYTDLTYTSGSGNILLDALSTTINVTDTTGFAASGVIVINSERITYSGVTSTSFTGCTRGAQSDETLASTTINGGINASVTTITLTSVTGFTVPTTFGITGAYAVVKIGNEIISYTGVNSASKTLTGCTRGIMGTTAASHSTGAAIVEYAGVQHGLDPTTGATTPPAIKVYQVTNALGTTGWGEASNIEFGSGIGQQMRLWSNDNYGEDLLLNPRGGKIYYWSNNTATYPAAEPLVPDVPIVGTNQVVVSDVTRFVIAMGCNSYGSSDFDPLVVRWSDQEEYDVWDPTIPGSQAGDARLTNGSFIMTSKKTRQEILIWTDAALYSMQFLGPPYVFGFTLLGDNLSIMSPNAATVVNNVAYWLGTDKFYTYTGRVETLPCAVRQYIFNDLNFDQRFQIVAGVNEGYNEVWWYYVSNTEVALAAQESRVPTIDKYVIYNHLEQIWYYGSLSRTFWLDTPIQSNPLAAYGDTETGTLLFHETGVDDLSTTSALPFTAYIQSSDFDINDGHNFGFVWRIIPDISFAGSGGNENNVYPSVVMEVRPRAFPGTGYGPTEEDTVTSSQAYGPVKQYTVEQFTPQVYTRVRGRQIAFKISSGGQLGVTWQLGSPRIDIRPDGRRGS